MIYIFKTEEEAITARKIAADYMGLPKEPNSVTTYWVDYNYSELDEFYYIQYVEDLEKALGQPVDVEITQPIKIKSLTNG
jgi:hypothetical protein